VLVAEKLIRKVFKLYARQCFCSNVCSLRCDGALFNVDLSVLNEFLNKAYSLATPRELSFLDTNKITQHHLSVGEICRRRLGHVPSKTTHGGAELRHGVDSNIEKLANQRCISTHNEFIRRVKDGKRFKVGAWIYRQLASISMVHAVLDQEMIDVSLLATTDSVCDLVISIADR